MALYAVATPSVETLTDVLVTNRTTGDILEWNGSAWVNVPGSSIVSGYVPYTGATSNVNLGAFNLICAEVLTDTVIAENLYFNSVPYDVMVCTSVTSGQLTNVQMGSNLTFFEGQLSVTNAALTRTNDTNVTLTLTGSAGSALLAAVNLAVGWTGTLAATRGGTGFGSYAVGDILYADTTTSLAKLADVATGNVLLSGGVGVAPSWGRVSASSAITGVLPIANGGTNASSQTSNGICYYDGSKITTSSKATLSFIAGDLDLLLSHPTVAGTAYEIAVTSSSCQYLMAFNTVSAFQGICGTAATENYWTLSTKGIGLSVSASALWFGSTSNDDVSFYRNTTERLRLMTTGVYVPDVLYLSAASPTINAMVTGTTLIQSSVRLVSAYAGAASANSHYFLGSGNDGGLLQLFGASGTIASPTALTTDSRMGGLFGRGYAATGYSNAVAAVTFHAESTFADTSTPTYIAFATTASGATTRTEAMRITSAGNLLLGTTSTSARITLGGSPVMQTLIRNDATLTASGNNADQYGFINYNNMTFTGGSANYATGHYADLKVNVPGGATVVHAQALVAIGPTNLGAGSVTHAKALRATAPTVGTASNVAAALTNVSIGGSYVDTTPPADGAIIQGKVGIGTTNPGAALDVKSNGGTINLTGADHTYIQFYPDGAAAGRKGYLGYPSAGNDDIYIANEISGADVILLPNGGNVGIGTTNPGSKLQVTADANIGSNWKNAQLRIGGSTNSNYQLNLGYDTTNNLGVIQSGEDGTAYKNLALNPNGGNVGIGTTGPTTKLNIKESGTNNAVVFIEPGTWAPGYYAEIRFGDANHYIRGEWGAGINIYDVNRIALTGSNVGIGTTTPANLLTLANNNYIAWRNGANSGETVGITSTSSDDMQFYVTATQLTITSGGNVVIGNQNALATNATNGFMYIRTCAGTPTGTPTAYTGHVAMLYDTTNNKLYAYNGSWRSVTLT